MRKIALIIVLCAAAVTVAATAAWHNVLPQGRRSGVTAMAIDASGLMWAGTSNGLFNYDGYNFYPSRLKGTPPPGHVHVLLAVDSLLYAGAADGLYIINVEKMTIRRPTGDFPGEIRALLADGNRLWIGSLNGLYSYDTATGHLSARYEGLPHRAVYSLLKEPERGDIFIGTYDGLARMDRGGRISRLSSITTPTGATNTFVNAMAYDPASRRLWIGLEGALYSYRDGPERTTALEGHSVKTLALRPGGGVFAGTDDGLVSIDPEGRMTTYMHDSRRPTSIANNSIWNLMTDAAGNVWAGTDAGISIMATRPPRLRQTTFESLSGAGDDNAIRSILRARNGHLWLGGSNGLIELDGDNRLTAWYKSSVGDHRIGHPHVRALSEGGDGVVWVATDGGLHHFDPATRRLVSHRITDPSGQFAANWVYGVIDDGSDVWTGSYLGGIHSTPRDALLRTTTVMSAKAYNSAADSVLTGDLVSALVADGRGNKWLTLTADSALIRIDGTTGAVSRHTLPVNPLQIVSDGELIWYADNGVRVGAVDTSGKTVAEIAIEPLPGQLNDVLALALTPADIIVCTTTGVRAIDRRSLESRWLPLPTGRFTAAAYDSASNSLLLADDSRLIEVGAESLAPGSFAVGERLRISGVKVNGVDNEPLFSRLRSGERIEIPFDSGDVSVEVSSFDYTPDPMRRIAYSIDGGPAILVADGTNAIELSQLPIGSHSVSVAIVGSGAPSLTFEVEVAPPWWASKGAFAVYALIIASIVTGIWFMMRRRSQHKIAAAERERALRAVDERLTFLSNISHDLKTPLSMIIGPVSQMKADTTDESLSRRLDTVYNAALRLNTLIHRTVELDRLESGDENMLILSRIEAVEFCRSIVSSYVEAFPEKHFVFTSSASEAYIEADAVKLESVINNLLSNACKYSGSNATVSTDVSIVGDMLKITVADDGLGIPEDEHGMIFQRTFRSSRTAHVDEGTGIGLFLLKKYVEAHNGAIDLESRENQGTTITVSLPLSTEQPEAAAGKPDSADNRPRVLIVDDNATIAAFLCEALGEKFSCVSACNGRAALAVAASVNPDAIVADEMMPVMSGLEMTRRLRENKRLATIPVILLTAKDDTVTQAAAVEAGVDAFVAKPFDTPLLIKRLSKLIERYRARQASLRVESLTTPAPVEIESVAERQLATLTSIIEKYIDDPQLNVTFLSEKSGIYQKQLYRLVKKYVGVTPVDFIRQTRLRRAAMLLGQRKFTVSEVMYMVGFSSTSYFSKCFSAMYNCTPSQYVERQDVTPGTEP